MNRDGAFAGERERQKSGGAALSFVDVRISWPDRDVGIVSSESYYIPYLVTFTT